MHERETFVRRVLIALGIAVIFVFGFLASFYAGHVVLVAFAGVLLAIYFRTLADFLGLVVPLSGRWRVGVVLLAHLGLGVLFAWYAAPLLENQARALAEQLPSALEKLQNFLREQAWGRSILGMIPGPEAVGDGQLVGLFSSGVSGLVDVVVIIIVGVYGALEPETYRRGFLLLLPPRHRDRASEVVGEAMTTLRHFLLGSFGSATIIGVCSAVGLALLGVPLPVFMGLLAGLLTFVPNIGPIISVIPPALLALMESPRLALWVLVLYAGLQFLESYIITPMIQRRAVELPPALLILAQVMLGVLAGPLGIAMAAPLTALGMVLIRELHVDEPDEVPEPGDEASDRATGVDGSSGAATERDDDSS